MIFGRVGAQLTSGLGPRLLTTLAVVLCLATAASLALFFPFYRYERAREGQAVSARLSEFLQISLENAMMKRDLDGLRDIVAGLGRIENVAGVDILDRQLEIRFSSSPPQLGARRGTIEDLCRDCGLAVAKAGNGTAFVTDSRGREVLRSVVAIANRESCTGCHGTVAEHPINGFLVVDSFASAYVARAWRTAALASIAAFIISLLAMAATWLALRRSVLQPVASLTNAAQAIAGGDLAARATVDVERPDGDEIAALGRSFNAMADQLAANITRTQERDEFLQGVLDAIPDGIRVIDKDYSVVAANREFCRQVGLSQQEVLSRPCYASSHRRDEPCVPTLVLCPLAELSGEQTTLKCTHVHQRVTDGAELAVEVVAAPLATGKGQRRRIVEAIRDLSHDVEVSLGQRLSEIGQLATGVAHEIHNPLASIQFGLSALKSTIDRGKAADEAQQYIALVAREIERCIEVTGRLMRLSQGTTERGTLLDLAALADGVVSLLRYEAEARKIALVVAIPKPTPVIGNESDLGMVLVNLIQNAFHATAAGGRIEVIGRPTTDGNVELVVTDTGKGIAAEDLPHIFQPFWTRRADRTEGSGLGLAICKALVAKWHGTISVTSRIGHGTRFLLVFPEPDKAMDAA